MRHIEGLREIAVDYDGFIIDLWGVVHDGVTPYPAALDCLGRLRGRPITLLSNAPRRGVSAQSMLRLLGVGDELYSNILTSGEAAWLALRDRTDPWFARLGHTVYHLGPQRDRNVLDGLGLRLVGTPEKADFLLNTGPDDDAKEPRELAVFVPELDECLRAQLPMICANPDLSVVRGGVRLLCAGALAEYYRQAGGDVFSLGKPDPAIYRMALEMLAVPADRVLAIGDSLRTDVAGAAGYGLASVWVLDGVHADQAVNEASARSLASDYKLCPTAMMRRLAW